MARIIGERSLLAKACLRCDKGYLDLAWLNKYAIASKSLVWGRIVMKFYSGCEMPEPSG